MASRHPKYPKTLGIRLPYPWITHPRIHPAPCRMLDRGRGGRASDQDDARARWIAHVGQETPPRDHAPGEGSDGTYTPPMDGRVAFWNFVDLRGFFQILVACWFCCDAGLRREGA